MKSSLAACIAALTMTCGAQAQVYVRAPFVRVGVGGPGVSVRAPFVNLFIPTNPPVYYAPPGYYGPGYYGPGYGGSGLVVPRYYSSDYTQPSLPPGYVPAPPKTMEFVPPAPKVVDRPPPLPPDMPEVPDVEPPAKGAVSVLSVDEFVKSFKPRGGSYEIDLINPVTKAATNVRFTLPDGLPKSVQYRGNTVEFSYGPLRFVRIEFDKDGAVVTSR